jgi:ATP-binding cassette, subfamily C, bacterial
VNPVLREYISTLYKATGWQLLLSVLLAALCSLTEGIGILLLIPTLQVSGLNLMGQGRVQSYAAAIDVMLRRMHLPPSLPILLLIFMVLISARTLMQKLEMVVGSEVQQGIQAYLRERLHRAIVGADWLFLCRKKSSDLVHVLTSEVERIGMATVYALLLAGDVLVTAIYVAVAAALSIGVTLMVLGAGLLLAIVLREKTRALQALGSEMGRTNQLLYGAVIAHVQSLKTTKAYNAESHDREVFGDLSSAVSDVRNDAARKQAFSSGWFESGSIVILITAIYISIRVFAVGSAGILILLLVFARLMPRVVAAYSHYQGIINQLPAFSAVTALERECAGASEQLDSDAPPIRFGHLLELRNISFAYHTAMGLVIRNASLAIGAGQTVALAGSSGSGKSTLADLAIGLLRPDMGTVAVDGIELTRSNLAGWRAQIGYVSQDTVLFHDTVRSNLTWARREVSEDEMWHALRLAAAEDLVRKLPAGLDTIVGDRGAFLSHGERQRLAIARALLRKPALLVLDEATNSLDHENEARVLEAIDNLHGELTILIIAHRFSTIKRADIVYVIDHGRIVDSGTWESLVAKQRSLEYLPDVDELAPGLRSVMRH